VVHDDDSTSILPLVVECTLQHEFCGETDECKESLTMCAPSDTKVADVANLLEDAQANTFKCVVSADVHVPPLLSPFVVADHIVDAAVSLPEDDVSRQSRATMPAELLNADCTLPVLEDNVDASISSVKKSS
jgi:hypothetical protein